MLSYLLSPVLRKRRVSMGAWPSYPSNHGTRPNASPTNYFVRSVSSLPMASAATSSVSSASQYAARHVSPVPFETVTVERDEMWVKQLEEQQKAWFQATAKTMYDEHLQEMANLGPFASPMARDQLQKEYDERLESLREAQKRELDMQIELERQERLWSLGQENKDWEAWELMREEQQIILEGIRREAQRSGRISPKERSRRVLDEQIQEQEDAQRIYDQFELTEPSRLAAREQWREMKQKQNKNLSERREKDRADMEAEIAERRAMDEHSTQVAEEARIHAAELRGQSNRPNSVPMPIPRSESSNRASYADGTFSSSPTAASNLSAGSSMFWKPDPMRSDTSFDNSRRSSSGSTSFTESTTTAASRPKPTTTGTTPSPSPLSGANSKGDDPPPVRWIPSNGTGEPTRQTAPQPERPAPAPSRKTSMLFGASPMAPPPSKLDDPYAPRREPAAGKSIPTQSYVPPVYSQSQSSYVPHRPPQRQTSFSNATTSSASSSASQSQAQRPTFSSSQHANPNTTVPPIYEVPPAPGIRMQPLPQTDGVGSQPPYTPPRQNMPQSQSQSRPSPIPTPTSAAKSSTSQYTSNPSTAKSSFGGHTPSSFSTSASASAGIHTSTSFHASSSPKASAPFDSDSYRARLRAEYTAKGAERAEEERRRRENEINERRAEEARKRGEEKRRKEEEEREAEQRARRAASAASSSSYKSSSMFGADRPVIDVWNAYESQWSAMATASQLRFRSIPWPVLAPVSKPEMLLPIKIAAFILNPGHSQSKTRKDRLREALLRWHPDRFETKWLGKVVEEEREEVKEGVGLVVRALNDLLSTEGTFSG